MSLWRQLTRGLRVLTDRTAADQDVTDEMQDYLEQATAEHIARGLTPDEARRTVQLVIGNTSVLREQVRTYGWENALGTLFSDLRYAARRLHSNPGFTSVSVLTLALGIGATTAIFSAVNPILFKSLPYPNASRIMMIREMNGNGRAQLPAFGTYYGLAERNHSFDALAVMKPWLPTMTGPAQPERLEGQSVSAN